MTIELEKRIQAAHAVIMSTKEWAFIGPVLMTGKVVIVDNEHSVKTAATDGWTVYYNADFCNDLTNAQLRFAVLHEALHKMFRHCTNDWPNLLPDYNETLANMAMDYLINGLLLTSSVKHFKNDELLVDSIPGILFSKKYTGKEWDTVKIYKDLISNTEKITLKVSWDNHDLFIKKAENSLSDDQKNQIAQAIDQAYIMAMDQNSILSYREITPTYAASIPWEVLLQNLWQSYHKGYDLPNWHRPNPVYAALEGLQNVYFPSFTANTSPHVSVLVDTSGSVSKTLLDKLAGEIGHLASQFRPASLTIGWWDTKLHLQGTVPEIMYNNLASWLKPVGNGATSPKCLMPYLEERPASKNHLVIVITDGYFSAVDLGDNIHWIITPYGTDKNILSGDVIQISY